MTEGDLYVGIFILLTSVSSILDKHDKKRPLVCLALQPLSSSVDVMSLDVIKQTRPSLHFCMIERRA